MVALLVLVLHKYEAVVPLAVNVTEPPAQMIASLLPAPDASISVIVTEGVALTVPVTVVVAVVDEDVAVIDTEMVPTVAKSLNLTYNVSVTVLVLVNVTLNE